MTVILQEYNIKPVRPLRNHVSLTSVLFQRAPDLGQTHARSLLHQNETFGDVLLSWEGKQRTWDSSFDDCWWNLLPQHLSHSALISLRREVFCSKIYVIFIPHVSTLRTNPVRQKKKHKHSSGGKKVSRQCFCVSKGLASINKFIYKKNYLAVTFGPACDCTNCPTKEIAPGDSRVILNAAYHKSTGGGGGGCPKTSVRHHQHAPKVSVRRAST